MESKLLKKIFFVSMLIAIVLSLLVIAFAVYLREWVDIIIWVLFIPLAIMFAISFIFQMKYRLREVEKKMRKT